MINIKIGTFLLTFLLRFHFNFNINIKNAKTIGFISNSTVNARAKQCVKVKTDYCYESIHTRHIVAHSLIVVLSRTYI